MKNSVPVLIVSIYLLIQLLVICVGILEKKLGNNKLGDRLLISSVFMSAIFLFYTLYGCSI